MTFQPCWLSNSVLFWSLLLLLSPWCQWVPSYSMIKSRLGILMSTWNLLVWPSTTTSMSSTLKSIKNRISWAKNNSIFDLGKTLHHGQPLCWTVLLLGAASHSWSGPCSHFHHTFRPDPATTWSGVRSLFLVGCHSLAISGYWQAKLLVIDTFLPLQ